MKVKNLGPADSSQAAWPHAVQPVEVAVALRSSQPYLSFPLLRANKSVQAVFLTTVFILRGEKLIILWF